MAGRDKATNQMEEFKSSQGSPDILTTGIGSPVGNKNASQTVGPRGPVLLQDFVFTDEMAHFNRERIPERVVHAKGAGAFGYFECTHDVTKYTKLAPFGFVGKKTPLAMYTEEGNWDMVGNNTPIFFIRDPFLFPSFIHTQKRNPQTHLKDPDMFWDFISLRPETAHQVSFLFSDRGTPNGYRFMNGYGSHTFKLISGTDPDYAMRDLYNAIAEGNSPSWSLKIQIWPQGEFPLIPVGRMVLNRNPKNYFAEVEQIAFSPAHMIPGVEASPDKMLQGRLFSYSDTHRHRLGSNYLQIPVNCPYNARPVDDPKWLEHMDKHSNGQVGRYNTADDDNFTQVGTFFNKVLTDEGRENLTSNIAGHLIGAQEFIQKRAIGNFAKADPMYGRMIQEKIDKLKAKNQSKPVAAQL
ncbi:CATA-like protein [Mya arenaria]|uniref:Catalase n=1 Tax=Mya arenaria TaxID=6604 RepID=A0ABY7EFV2_MYAAR|nr:CATA-like protein [Mya arenaria]